MKLKIVLSLLLSLPLSALAHEGHDDEGTVRKPKKQVQVLRGEEPPAPTPEGKPEDKAAPKKTKPPEAEQTPAPKP